MYIRMPGQLQGSTKQHWVIQGGWVGGGVGGTNGKNKTQQKKRYGNVIKIAKTCTHII